MNFNDKNTCFRVSKYRSRTNFSKIPLELCPEIRVIHGFTILFRLSVFPNIQPIIWFPPIIGITNIRFVPIIQNFIFIKITTDFTDFTNIRFLPIIQNFIYFRKNIGFYRS
jgi:hypothetical protein